MVDNNLKNHLEREPKGDLKEQTIELEGISIWQSELKVGERQIT